MDRKADPYTRRVQCLISSLSQVTHSHAFVAEASHCLSEGQVFCSYHALQAFAVGEDPHQRIERCRTAHLHHLRVEKLFVALGGGLSTSRRGSTGPCPLRFSPLSSSDHWTSEPPFASSFVPLVTLPAARHPSCPLRPQTPRARRCHLHSLFRPRRLDTMESAQGQWRPQESTTN